MSKRRKVRVCRGSIPVEAQPPSVDLHCLRRLAEEALCNPPKRERQRAARRPRHPQRDDVPGPATPTAFADWVFWKVNPNHRPPLRGRASVRVMWNGRYDHAQIEELRLWLQRDSRAGARIKRDQGWHLVYADPPDKHAQRTFQASRLLVGGHRVTGRPDVVLRSATDGGVIVLERKVLQRTEVAMPKDGYANHWCQLWCYGWMDAWADAPYVMLVLQYWRRDWSRNPLAKVHSVAPVRFCRSPGFEDWARKWFRAYGGRVV